MTYRKIHPAWWFSSCSHYGVCVRSRTSGLQVKWQRHNASFKWEQLHRELEAQLFTEVNRAAREQLEIEEPDRTEEEKTKAFEDWCIRRAIKLGRERELSRAARALHPAEPAPANLDTVQALLALHPPR